MNAVDLMQLCRLHGQEVQRLAERAEELQDGMTRMGGGAGSAQIRASMGDRFADYAARLDEVETSLKNVRRHWAAEQMVVILLTDTFPDAQRKCLREFYCYGRSAARLAEDMNYTVSNVYKVLHDAREGALRIPEEEVLARLPIWYAEEARANERR